MFENKWEYYMTLATVVLTVILLIIAVTALTIIL